MIKTVLLDIDNTLLNFDECSREAMKRAFDVFGIKYSQSIFDAFLEVNFQLWRGIEKQEITKAQLHQRRWNTVFAKAGITGVDGEEVEKVFHTHIAELAIPVDGAKDLLEYLSSKYTVCLASNASYAQQVHRLKLAGLFGYADKLFTSELIGYPKPERKFFDACFSELDGVSPSQTVMIGDAIAADIVGAKSYGMLTCWYSPDTTAQTPPEADWRVSSLLQIKNIL